MFAPQRDGHGPSFDRVARAPWAGARGLPVALGLCMLASALGASAAGPDNGKLAMQSRVELSVHTAAPLGPMLLRLQGQAFGGQVVELAQSGLVFFEQQLSEGPLLIDKLTPLNPTLPVSMRLRTPSQPEEQGELRLQPQEKLALLTKRPERLTPEPAPVPAPPHRPPKPPLGKTRTLNSTPSFCVAKPFATWTRPASTNSGGCVRATLTWTSSATTNW